MHPLTSHKIFVPVYEAYTARAFGSVEEGRAVKPVVVDDWVSEWPKGKEVVLMQSREDTLVPYSQLEIMQRSWKGRWRSWRCMRGWTRMSCARVAKGWPRSRGSRAEDVGVCIE